MKITDKQHSLLLTLKDEPRTITYLSGHYSFISKSAMEGSLRRMEDRGLVRRLGMFPAKWELTQLGRNQL